MKFDSLLKRLRQKPDTREKILFGIMLGSFIIFFLKSCAWTNHQKVSELKASITNIQQQQKELLVQRPTQTQTPQKRWVGTQSGIQDASEIALNSYYLPGIKIIKNELSPVTTEEGLQKRELKMSVTGSYQALETYLNYLENRPVPAVINDFVIKISDEDHDILILELSGGLYGAN